MTQAEKIQSYTAKMLGPVPPADYTGNGMGVEGTLRLVRWALWNIPNDTYELLNACAARFHDYACGKAKSKAERVQADDWLAANCRTILTGECGWLWQAAFLRWDLWRIRVAVGIGTDLAWLALLLPAVMAVGGCVCIRIDHNSAEGRLSVGPLTMEFGPASRPEK